jgi:hypothetical protein
MVLKTTTPRQLVPVLLALTFTAAATTLGTATPAGAQGPGGGFGRGGGMGFGGGPMGGNNPLQSNPMGLLQRVEVQKELGLSVRQKEQITELQTGSRDLARQRMGQVFQGQDFRNMRNLSPEERRAKMQELQPQIQSAMAAFQGELNDKMKEILKPEQMTRLHQLDLRRRGPLSLADAKVADEIKLTPANRTEVAKIVADYQQQSGEVMRAAFEAARASGQFPDFQSRLSPVKQKMDKTRKAAEEKVVALLSDEEKAAWDAAQGEPFTFRTDPIVPRPNFPGGGRQGGRGQRGGAADGGFPQL